MKNKYNIYTFASNGFSFRAKNKRITVVEDEEGAFHINFTSYNNNPKGNTALTSSRLGLDYTQIKLSLSSLEALAQGFLEYQRQKENEHNNL